MIPRLVIIDIDKINNMKKPKSDWKSIRVIDKESFHIYFQPKNVNEMYTTICFTKREKDSRLIEMAPALYRIAKDFCAKVDRGEASSKKTYKAMKEILNYVGV